jgi:hypothetical protein
MTAILLIPVIVLLFCIGCEIERIRKILERDDE